MSWPLVEIGKLVSKVNSWNPLKSDLETEFDYIDLSSIDKDRKIVDLNAVTKIEPQNAPSRARQLVATNDVLVATVRPNLNGVAHIESALDGATASTGYCVLRPLPKKLDSRYLFHWVQSYSFVADMMSKATGANYPAVSDKVIKQSFIPLPPLDEQKRIAAILDKADAIRRKRQQAIQLADDFLRSVFLDMFGDPVTNPRGWKRKKLKEFADVTTGNTPSRKVPEYFGGELEWIKSDNINTPSHILTTATEFLSPEGEKKARTVEKGSTLITCIAGSFECIGNAAIADRKVSFNQQINAVTPKSEYVREWFLYALILFSKKIIQSASTNSMKGMVSKGKLEEVEFILPSLDMQVQFEELFDKQIKLRDRINVSNLVSVQNFNAISYKAFAGNL
ncbi:restriction endonuclease subunit S [Neptunicella sp.]|uniref:restriction endonuclease subunit S n=1 Tax=Neptunicella sp. TaxID=2125986 RepID=UPI003F69393C